MPANEPAADATPAPPKKKSRLPLILIVAVVLLTAGGGGAYFLLGSAHGKARAPKVELSKTDLYLPLEPPFVVNFQDGDSLRYLQVGITLMSHDPQAIATAKDSDPVIRNALVALLSNQQFAFLSTAAGRQKLQAQALAAVQKVVAQRLHRPGIEALYFTSYVMQ
ncbi:MAG: flagellar basal body protein FliL [Rhodanobacter sp.]|nr:MAG: flagellar basal body protein FliL [Rhodanobacter sp.]TAM37106.1 MAG: flagellar basal body protein FliL [Rhodanobacter sp.]